MGSSESTLMNDLYKDDSAAAEDDDASAEIIGAVLVLAFVFLLAYVAVTLCFGSSKKTMKAPGKDTRIPRGKFEQNPKQYFLNLRKK
ncbi:hypothetical protein I3843_05G048600 [Carya illinoinensis]|uniref:Uncharacterized protein n=1 Tax=Carya illinoinensis TaxID=32201 RepID=A0A922JKS7_CARIL|nr:hypothetical protein I3760_05G055600 [Carya illinoinensis]KAG6711470.1 hypothetical protein I3842_05G055100 [Carya illinoinensis]KAG7977783.1 hypothetical protein I3843_05G048600 [Carya illinoinensis]